MWGQTFCEEFYLSFAPLDFLVKFEENLNNHGVCRVCLCPLQRWSSRTNDYLKPPISGVRISFIVFILSLGFTWLDVVLIMTTFFLFILRVLVDIFTVEFYHLLYFLNHDGSRWETFKTRFFFLFTWTLGLTGVLLS